MAMMPLPFRCARWIATLVAACIASMPWLLPPSMTASAPLLRAIRGLTAFLSFAIAPAGIFMTFWEFPRSCAQIRTCSAILTMNRASAASVAFMQQPCVLEEVCIIVRTSHMFRKARAYISYDVSFIARVAQSQQG